MFLVTSHISAPCPRNSHLHLLHPHWRPPSVSPAAPLEQQKKGIAWWVIWEQTCPNICQNPEPVMLFLCSFSFVLIKWSLENVGSRRIMLAHVAPLKCPITKAPTLQASSWTGRPMSSRSTWGNAMEEDEIPYHLLMRWRHVRIIKVVMETCEYSKNTYSTKLYRLYRSL